MEWEAALETVLFRLPAPGCRFVQPGQLPHRPDRLRTPRLGVPQRLGLEEPAPQHFRHVLPTDRLHALLPLPAEHVEQIADQPLAFRSLLLGGIRSQQRGHQHRAIHLRRGLYEVLEEVDDAMPPHAVLTGLLPRVHEDLVDQDERSEAALLRALQQLDQQGLGRRSLAFLGTALAMDRPQPVVAGELVREHAPGVAKHAGIAFRGTHSLDAALDIDLVEAQRSHMRSGQLVTRVLPELTHRRHVRQTLGIPEQVIESDQRVRLAAAVGQLQLPHGLVASPREPRRHITGEIPQRVRWIGQGEELVRLLVHRPLAPCERDLMQIGGELRQRQFARAQLVLQPDDLVPGLGAWPGHQASDLGNHVRRVPSSSLKARSSQPAKSTEAASFLNKAADGTRPLRRSA